MIETTATDLLAVMATTEMKYSNGDPVSRGASVLAKYFLLPQRPYPVPRELVVNHKRLQHGAALNDLHRGTGCSLNFVILF